MAIDLLEQMLTYNPRKRITAKEILAHPYIASAFPEDTSLYNYEDKTRQNREFPRKPMRGPKQMYLSNGTPLRRTFYEDSQNNDFKDMKGSLSAYKMDLYSTNHRVNDPRSSLYVQKELYIPDKFEISSSGKIVPKIQKFHQSLYDPDEGTFDSHHKSQPYTRLAKKPQNYRQKPPSLRKAQDLIPQNKMRYSEYHPDQITPKTQTRRTIDFDQRAPKHLSYSHGGKGLEQVRLQKELRERKSRYDQRVLYGMEEDSFTGGLKMKKMQFEHPSQRHKFDTNYSGFTRGLDIYSKEFSPKQQVIANRMRKPQTSPHQVADKIIRAYEQEFEFDMHSDSYTQNSDHQKPSEAPIKHMLMRHHKKFPEGMPSQDRIKQHVSKRLYGSKSRKGAFGSGTGSSAHAVKKQRKDPRQTYRDHLKHEFSKQRKGVRSKPLSIDKDDEFRDLHDQQLKVQGFAKSKLRPTLKDLKQKYTDNDLGSYSMNVNPRY